MADNHSDHGSDTLDLCLGDEELREVLGLNLFDETDHISGGGETSTHANNAKPNENFQDETAKAVASILEPRDGSEWKDMEWLLSDLVTGQDEVFTSKDLTTPTYSEVTGAHDVEAASVVIVKNTMSEEEIFRNISNGDSLVDMLHQTQMVDEDVSQGKAGVELPDFVPPPSAPKSSPEYQPEWEIGDNYGDHEFAESYWGAGLDQGVYLRGISRLPRQPVQQRTRPTVKREDLREKLKRAKTPGRFEETSTRAEESTEAKPVKAIKSQTPKYDDSQVHGQPPNYAPLLPLESGLEEEAGEIYASTNWREPMAKRFKEARPTSADQRIQLPGRVDLRPTGKKDITIRIGQDVGQNRWKAHSLTRVAEIYALGKGRPWHFRIGSDNQWDEAFKGWMENVARSKFLCIEYFDRKLFFSTTQGLSLTIDLEVLGEKIARECDVDPEHWPHLVHHNLVEMILDSQVLKVIRDGETLQRMIRHHLAPIRSFLMVDEITQEDLVEKRFGCVNEAVRKKCWEIEGRQSDIHKTLKEEGLSPNNIASDQSMQESGSDRRSNKENVSPTRARVSRKKASRDSWKTKMEELERAREEGQVAQYNAAVVLMGQYRLPPGVTVEHFRIHQAPFQAYPETPGFCHRCGRIEHLRWLCFMKNYNPWCTYPFCTQPRGHTIRACKTLHGFCLRCKIRGHTATRCLEIMENGLPRTGDEWVQVYKTYADYGHFTRQRHQRPEWGIIGWPKKFEAYITPPQRPFSYEQICKMGPRLARQKLERWNPKNRMNLPRM